MTQAHKGQPLGIGPVPIRYDDVLYPMLGHTAFRGTVMTGGTAVELPIGPIQTGMVAPSTNSGNAITTALSSWSTYSGGTGAGTINYYTDPVMGSVARIEKTDSTLSTAGRYGVFLTQSGQGAKLFGSNLSGCVWFKVLECSPGAILQSYCDAATTAGGLKTANPSVTLSNYEKGRWYPLYASETTSTSYLSGTYTQYYFLREAPAVVLIAMPTLTSDSGPNPGMIPAAQTLQNSPLVATIPGQITPIEGSMCFWFWAPWLNTVDTNKRMIASIGGSCNSATTATLQVYKATNGDLTIDLWTGASTKATVTVTAANWNSQVANHLKINWKSASNLTVQLNEATASTAAYTTTFVQWLSQNMYLGGVSQLVSPRARYASAPGVLRTIVGTAPTITRASVATDPYYGTQATSGTLRVPSVTGNPYLQGIGNCGFLAEETSSNILSLNQSSVETDLTGFSTLGSATQSRDTTKAWIGSASVKVITGGAVNDGTSVSQANASGGAWTGSFYVQGTGNFYLLMRITYTDATTDQTTVNFTANSLWTRYVGSVTANGGKTVQTLSLFCRSQDTTGGTVYLDGWQIENKGYATTWVAGAASRSADVVTVPAAALSPTAGTIIIRAYVDNDTAAATATASHYLMSIGDANDGIRISRSGGFAIGWSTRILVGGTTYLSDVSLTALSTGWHTFGFNWNGTTMNSYEDGVLKKSISAGTPIAFTSNLFIGSSFTSASQWNSPISDFITYGTALTDAEMVELGTNLGSHSAGANVGYYDVFLGAAGLTMNDLLQMYKSGQPLFDPFDYSIIAV